MKDPKQQVSQTRRKFLRDVGVSGGIAAAAAAAPGIALAEVPEDRTDKDQREGYRLTEHVLAYYKSAAS
ncbi:MAG: twin-arginine translocation signal domain-containing protein [Chromatiaceae bacterium]|jgi:hypothetical protein